MAAPAIRGATQAAIDANGAATSPAGTQIGDLVLCFVWSQGTSIPTHTIQSGFTELRTHSHNDGSTDGRLSCAAKIATVAGAQSYQAYSVSGATANQTCGAIVVLEAGTFADWDLAALAYKQGSTTSTGTGAPDPPSVAGLFGDWTTLAIAAWHVTTAGSTTTSAPTNYTERVDGPTGSHVTHLAVATREQTALSNVTENPGAFTDNVTPNGTASMTIAIPGASVPVHLVAANGTGVMPTGTLPGDLVHVFLGHDANIGTYSGWTQIGSQIDISDTSVKSFWRIWQVGDSMPSWGTVFAGAASYRFAHQDEPIIDENMASTPSGTTADLGTLDNDAGEGNSAVAWCGGISSGSHTPPANYLEAIDTGTDVSALYRTGLAASSSTGGSVTTPSGLHVVSHLILRQVSGETALAVTGASITSTAALNAPTVVPGDVEVTTAHRASTAALNVPKAAYRIAAAFLASTMALHAPTVAPGPAAVTGATRASTLTLNAPSVSPGAVEVGAATRASTLTLNAPSVTPEQAASGAHIASSAQLFAPSATLGGTTITTAHRASTLTLFAPTASPGAVSVTAPHRGSTVALNAPAVAAEQTTSGAHVASTLTLTAPTLRYQLAAAHRASTATLQAPAASYRVAAAHRSSSATLSAPSIAVGDVAVAGAHLAAGTVVNAPQITSGGAILTGHRASTATLTAPTITTGAVSVTAGTIAAGLQLHALTVATGAVAIVAAHLAAATTLFAPALGDSMEWARPGDNPSGAALGGSRLVASLGASKLGASLAPSRTSAVGGGS